MAAAGDSEHMKAAEARDSLAISRSARPTPLTGSVAQGTSCIGKGTALACKSSKKAEKDVHRRNRALEKLCAKRQRRLPREACRHSPRVAEPVPAKTVINHWNCKASQSLLAGCTRKTYHQGSWTANFPSSQPNACQHCRLLEFPSKSACGCRS